MSPCVKGSRHMFHKQGSACFAIPFALEPRHRASSEDSSDMIRLINAEGAV